MEEVYCIRCECPISEDDGNVHIDHAFDGDRFTEPVFWHKPCWEDA